MTSLVALDLDRTLLYSARSAGSPLPPTTWVEELDGAPISLMTDVALDLLQALVGEQLVVPVTTRTVEQYSRVQLPAVEMAVCANGGVLLVDGVRSREWDAWVAGLLRGCAPVAEIVQLLDVAAEPWVRTVRQVEDLFAYLVAHSRSEIPADWLASLSAAATARGWTVSVQGRKVYAVPVALSKGAAARRLADERGLRLLAAGDSLLDRSLLDAADVAVRPPHGELHDLGWAPSWLHVTGRPGAVAAEDVLALLRAAA